MGQGCRPLPLRLAVIQASVPQVEIAETLTGDAAKRFMDAWNAEEPPTSETADTITALFTPVYPDIIHVVISNEGCVITSQGWSQSDYQRLKRGTGRGA